MSSKVAFQVHYGDFYRITRDSYGVNLSALERRQCSLDKPLERSFGSIRKWLHGKFNVNPKTHLLTVHTVTSWETNGDFWELTLISSTEEWKHYMQLPPSPHVSPFSLYECCLLQIQVWRGPQLLYWGEPTALPPGGRGLYAIALKF